MSNLTNLFEQDAIAPLAFTAMPRNPALQSLATAAHTLAVADANLKRAEALVAAIKQRRQRLATKVLPELFDQLQTDHWGLNDLNCDIIVENYYHAVIKADWPDAQRKAAFAHLEELGAGDLIKAEMTITFQREDLEAAKELEVAIKLWLKTKKLDIAPMLNLNVPWATLTAFVKSEMEKPIDPHAAPSDKPKMNLEKLGATVGRICKIVMRKVATKTRTRKSR